MGRIQDFLKSGFIAPEEGRQPQMGVGVPIYYLEIFFLKNCMKMKKIGPGRGMRASRNCTMLHSVDLSPITASLIALPNFERHVVRDSLCTYNSVIKTAILRQTDNLF